MSGDIDKRFNDWESGRVDQLLSYMQDCQQGMRDVKDHILSVIAVAVSMLTVFFGVSIFGEKISSSVARENGRILSLPEYGIGMLDRTIEILEESITIRRLAFWFTSIIFMIAVLYILVLGIDIILRYHYCQNLGDRLHSLIRGAADDEGRNSLVIYEQFSSPIKTGNFNHLTNSHNLLHFSAHYMSGGLAFSFSIGAILTQFALLEKHYWYDWFTLILVGLVITTALLLFIRFNLRSDEIVDTAFSVAHKNLDVRLGIGDNKELYKNSKHFIKAFIYLIFPRGCVIHKDAFIIAGFLVVSLKQGDFYPLHLIFVLLIYSFLLCNARYQLNDLRGIQCDKEEGKTGRLFAGGNVNRKYLLNVSIVVFILRIVLAIILMLFLGRGLKIDILICAALLISLTFLYELFRSLNIGFIVILLAGASYPLRVYIGAAAANVEIAHYIKDTNGFILLFIFWLWGILGCLLNWARDVEELIKKEKMRDGKHPKQHYEIIYGYIKDRIDVRETQGPSFLLNKYRFNDKWNLVFWFLLVMIVFAVVFQQKSVIVSIVELVLVLLCGITSICTTIPAILCFLSISMLLGVCETPKAA